ncbi:hypothetical protein SPISAL_00840 [Spiribacter salinus M19-40]|uniref:Uncharacterized protein n=1 Tax=Spiribacter salinus M19-40 TaxID=1260251 RepID=R4VI26_9GAMM|nr:hypothetical protein SPISAL_00840 [Spiribacter salinus M19-40]
MIRWAHQSHPILGEVLKDQIDVQTGIRRNPEIHAPTQHPLLDMGRCSVFDRHLNVGIGIGKAGQHCRQRSPGIGGNGGQGDLTGAPVGVVQQIPTDPFMVVDQRFDTRVMIPPERRQCRLAPALEQRLPQLRLKVANGQ